MRRFVPLAFLAAAACSSAPAPAEPAPVPVVAGPDAPPARCVPEGDYAVRVDLSSAQISQVNTGMSDTVWCKSILGAVPAQSMTAMKIAYTDGKLAVDWAGAKALTIESDCEFEILSPPMPAKIVFAGGHGTGTTTYSIGTDNHPDESCTATGATLRIEPVAR